MTETRTKEIGIRRVLGVPVSGITILLTKEFLKWILLANMAAIPIVYFAVTKWLQNFVYRVDIELWVLLSPLSLILLSLFSLSAIKPSGPLILIHSIPCGMNETKVHDIRTFANEAFSPIYLSVNLIPQRGQKRVLKGLPKEAPQAGHLQVTPMASKIPNISR